MKSSAWVAVLLVLVAGNAESATRIPVAASPGSASGVGLVEARCPTFSWGQVERARSYELVVYPIGEGEQVAQPALRQSLPGSLGSWTPSLDRCLERGQRYGWAVRAHSARAESPWSETLLFEIDSEPAALQVNEALAVLREYLANPVAQMPEGASAAVPRIPTQVEENAPTGSAAEPAAVATTTALQLGLGAYQGGTEGSVVAGHTKQMIIAGEYNTGPNTGSSVKLLISDYDNEASDIYPIYVEDENNFVDFYVRKQAGRVSSAHFGGSVGIGTSPDPDIPLYVKGGEDAEPASGGHLVLGPVGGVNLALDSNEVMARNGGLVSQLYLNADGGDVIVGQDLVVNGVLDIGYQIVRTFDSSVDCPSPKMKVLGGGCATDSLHKLVISQPTTGPAGWICIAIGPNPDPPVETYAICANLGDS